MRVDLSQAAPCGDVDPSQPADLRREMPPILAWQFSKPRTSFLGSLSELDPVGCQPQPSFLICRSERLGRQPATLFSLPAVTYRTVLVVVAPRAVLPDGLAFGRARLLAALRSGLHPRLSSMRHLISVSPSCFRKIVMTLGDRFVGAEHAISEGRSQRDQGGRCLSMYRQTTQGP
jgi:hypothetical protein